MEVVVFDRTFTHAQLLERVCDQNGLLLTIHPIITNESLVRCRCTRILIFDQSVLGSDPSITSAMFASLPQDVIAVSCEKATVPYAVTHMRLGAKWVFSEYNDHKSLAYGLSNLIGIAHDLNVIYCEHLQLEQQLASMTAREWEVLQLVLEGIPNKTIAKSLDVSTRTIEARRARSYRKLRVNNAASLVRMFDRAAILRIQFAGGRSRVSGRELK